MDSDKDGNLAVIAVMFVEGKANESLSQAWAHMPENAGDKHGLSAGAKAEGILPSSRYNNRKAPAGEYQMRIPS